MHPISTGRNEYSGRSILGNPTSTKYGNSKNASGYDIAPECAQREPPGFNHRLMVTPTIIEDNPVKDSGVVKDLLDEIETSYQHFCSNIPVFANTELHVSGSGEDISILVAWYDNFNIFR